MPFNSLSRDHAVKLAFGPSEFFAEPLSTPSLGITEQKQVLKAVAEQAFQLPLSGSRERP